MRRVVVTGMGMVTPLGCGVEPTWKRLIAGESGAQVVDRFDISDIAAKVACTIPRGDGSNGTYNADQWMESKEQRKVDDFIVYAMAAARQALDDANWHPTEKDDQVATGVVPVCVARHLRPFGQGNDGDRGHGRRLANRPSTTEGQTRRPQPWALATPA